MIGRVVSHYRIESELGRGGMGVVYRAHDLKLDRLVVLKFLSPELVENEDAKRRLLREARAASALDHPNICAIFDIDEAEDGRTFLAMSYYEGEVLANRLRRGPVPIPVAVEVGTQVVTGLAASHARGIIHRDVKPGNIMVTTEGIVKLLDFGVAQTFGASRITRAGSIVGTTAYMSPEHLRGESVDGRTDIWSAGVVLYEMIVGRRPFTSPEPESLMRAIFEDSPPALGRLRPETPRDLQALISRALSKDAAGRYKDAEEMRTALVSVAAGLEGRSVLITPPSGHTTGEVGPGSTNAPGGGPRSDALISEESPTVSRQLEPRTWAPTRPTSRSRARWLGAGLALLLLLCGSLWYGQRRPAPSSDRAAAPLRLAVIPFSNPSHDPEISYLGFALADRIIDELTYVHGLVVRPSRSVRDFESGALDVVAASRKLRVDYLLTGRYVAELGRVRVDLDLTDGRSGSRRWREHLECALGDVAGIQVEVASKVMRGLNLGSSSGEPHQASVPHDALAYEAYLRSLSYPYSTDGTNLAVGALEESLRLDPSYAPAHVEYGNRLRHRAVYALAGPETARRAEAEMQQALSLDRGLLSALGTLGLLYTEAGRSDDAVAVLRRSLAIKQDHPDSHFGLSYCYRYAGMLQESAREGELALKLDPNNPRFRSLATTYLYLGDYARSLEVHRLDPDVAWTLARIGQIRLRRGERAEALASLNRAIAMEPDSSVGCWAFAMRAYLRGKPAPGLQALEKVERAGIVDGEQWYHFGNIHALLGDADGCLRDLEHAVDAGFFNYPFMLRDAFLDPLRRDPRFGRVLARARERHEAFVARWGSVTEGASRKEEP
jgi:serine/threonine-protein kinase